MRRGLAFQKLFVIILGLIILAIMLWVFVGQIAETGDENVGDQSSAGSRGLIDTVENIVLGGSDGDTEDSDDDEDSESDGDERDLDEISCGDIGTEGDACERAGHCEVTTDTVGGTTTESCNFRYGSPAEACGEIDASTADGMEVCNSYPDCTAECDLGPCVCTNDAGGDGEEDGDGSEGRNADWDVPDALDADWLDCGGPCGVEGRVTQVCTEAYDDGWFSNEVRINMQAKNTAGETGKYNLRIRPESGKAHVIRPCGGMIGCGLDFKELSAGEQWDASEFDSGGLTDGWNYGFVDGKGYVVQLRKQDPDDSMNSISQMDEKKYLVDAVLVSPEDIPDVGDEICVPFD